MDETLYSAETNEQYLQFAGFEYDKKNIENLSKMNFLISDIRKIIFCTKDIAAVFNRKHFKCTSKTA